ncbi:SHOCT domain-containing protein [Paenimyroides ceti]
MGLFGIFAWIMASFVVAAIGSDRRIGFFSALLWSILLSPVIGFFITLFSPSNESEERQKEMLELQRMQINNQNVNSVSIADELKKLKKLKKQGVISDQEYDKLKAKLLE